MKRIRDERPLRAVPSLVWGLLALALAAQIGWSSTRPAPRSGAEDLPWPPGAALLSVAALGEPSALGKLLMLWLQAFDFRATNKVPFRQLDYARVEAWLARILQLDPTGQYPLAAASSQQIERPT